MNVPIDFDPREPPTIVCDEGTRIFGPTRTEIAVRICETLLHPEYYKPISESAIAHIAIVSVQLTDQLITELKKKKPNAG